jgi:hypothetical protein
VSAIVIQVYRYDQYVVIYNFGSKIITKYASKLHL